jgi:hypothetical protein
VRARLKGQGPASGASVDAEVTSIVRFEDGKSASMRSFQEADARTRTGDPFITSGSFAAHLP